MGCPWAEEGHEERSQGLETMLVTLLSHKLPALSKHVSSLPTAYIPAADLLSSTFDHNQIPWDSEKFM